MVFRCPVSIGHYATRALKYKSLKIISIHTEAPKLCQAPNFLCKSLVPLTLAVDLPLVCHIIDDITIINMTGHQPCYAVGTRSYDSYLLRRSLPSAAKKSCPIAEFVSTMVPFIGLVIYLETGVVAPQTDKYDSFARRFRELPNTSTVYIREWQYLKVLCKLRWYATLTRPALSAFALVYHYPRPES